jgi:hypothetical protein
VEEFSEEAKYFTECRLLQRDVEIVLEGVSNANFVGSILHPKGNIAELLLREGFAKCVDWSISLATGGTEALRAAERCPSLPSLIAIPELRRRSVCVCGAGINPRVGISARRRPSKRR